MKVTRVSLEVREGTPMGGGFRDYTRGAGTVEGSRIDDSQLLNICKAFMLSMNQDERQFATR